MLPCCPFQGSKKIQHMSQETAFLGADTLLGKIWTKRRYFDYLISKDSIRLITGKSLHKLVVIDPALEIGRAAAQADAARDSEECDFILRHIPEIKPELTIFVTTADILAQDADETAPLITESDCPYVQNRLRLHSNINRQFGRVLNVYLSELAIATPEHTPLLACCTNPPAGRTKLPFHPLEHHQFYFHERLYGDVEKCIPLGISHFIPAMPSLCTEDIVELLAPKLLSRLPKISAEERVKSKPHGSRRRSIHSFHWLDPRDGYLVTLDDQKELLKFFFNPEA